MKNLHERKWLLVVLVLLVPALAGCRARLVRPGETMNQSETVELEGAESVRVHLQGSLRDVTLSGGATDLFAGEFRYNLEDLAVDVDYRVSDREGRLTIGPSVDNISSIPTGNVISEWELQFADNVPLDMDINLGLGDSNLDLSPLTLSGLAINSGAGNVTVNAGRQVLEDLNFQAGLGQVELLVPGGSVERLDFAAV